MLKLFVQEMYEVGEHYVVEGYQGCNMWWRERCCSVLYILYKNIYMSKDMPIKSSHLPVLPTPLI